MELFGIVFAVPAAFVAAAIYARLVRGVLAHWLIRRMALWLSIAVLGGLLLEWGALLALGVLRSRAIIGSAFYPLHLILFFLSVPAFANLLVIKRGDTAFGSWLTVALLCSILALPVVLTQYAVAETLYGVDGTGGPYGKAPTIPMPAWW
jgi:hypothetical protein